MTLVRLVDEKTAEEKTYEKLKRDLDVIGPAHPGRGRITSELNAVKAKMAAHRQP